MRRGARPDRRPRGYRSGSIQRALLAHLPDLRDGLAKLLEPFLLVPLHQTDAPGQRMRAVACDAGVDQRVEDLALRETQARHHRERQVREHLVGVADLHAPGGAAAKALLRLLADLHACVARLLAELLNATGPTCGQALGPGVLPELNVGERPDHPDLLAVHADLRGAAEPPLRDTAGEPASDLFGRCHCLVLLVVIV